MSSHATPVARPSLIASARRGVVRSGAMLLGAALVVLILVTVLALISYRPSDRSWSTAAAGDATGNWVGAPGAWGSDALLQLFGPPVVLLLPFALVLARRLLRDVPLGSWSARLLRCLAAILAIDVALALALPGSVHGLPAGPGGVAGLVIGGAFGALVKLVPGVLVDHLLAWAAALMLGTVGVVIWAKALDLDSAERALFRRHGGSPRLALPSPPPASADAVADPVAADTLADFDRAPLAAPARDRPPSEAARSAPVIADRKAGVAPSTRAPAAQASLLHERYQLPSLDLLTPAPPATTPALDKASIDRNARLLETVLEDFKVKGVINEVRPGPVVTMYELEPAAGIKASRVVALADDIARNMSAQSARVATIPGRSVIGIELPNARREAVVLHELVASQAFADQGASLPIILGKNIAGDPVIADLAPMPHLLVAGTTGSGKSVGLNAMIVSLLYRLTPDQCRMIMIDPKMLELSTYDDIPHLLAPVVTEPAKAIRALKWAVEQMEERYRMMASVGVRGLASFNDKVRAAKAKGASLGRRVQTGYDAETGKPVYEEETLDFEPLPQIVVIVDELADLMMTAGKEVEFLIQRLAQKARAAGIHLIMATQRPSVDVITGVIKANLPTRISFAVTSKIDSRTILGEQGAEQLLGKGDMLYMPGGKQVVRVHGPFVSDDEVRAVADHWRAQGSPDYNQSVTEEPEDGGFALDGAPSGDDSPEDQLYRKARQLVAESQKASVSWLQRQLRVGYNSAARLIERMEADGSVGRPDHVGRREVLMDTEGRPLN